MFLINGQKATLRQFNRETNTNAYDDQNYQDITIKCCPYNVEQTVKFGIYTVPEATGYYIVNRLVDVRESDQIKFIGNYKNASQDNDWHTILKVQDEWIYNRIEYYIIAVK